MSQFQPVFQDGFAGEMLGVIRFFRGEGGVVTGFTQTRTARGSYRSPVSREDQHPRTIRTTSLDADGTASSSSLSRMSHCLLLVPSGRSATRKWIREPALLEAASIRQWQTPG